MGCFVAGCALSLLFLLRGYLDPRFSLHFTFAFNICWDPRYTVAKINAEMRNAGLDRKSVV